MKSSNQHSFARVPNVGIPRSTFDRSFGHKTTFDVGQLIPLYYDEVLPGDTFNMRANIFARLLSPLSYPIMDNMQADYHFFFVPLRQIWTNFRKFMGEQVDPGDSIDYVIPMNTCLPTYGSFEDYIGWPGIDVANVTGSELYWRAYAHIYNEWYRDQNLQDSIDFNLDDTVDDADHPILKRNKRHDYFTSCLPWPQKGDAVSAPLSGYLNVQAGPDNATIDELKIYDPENEYHVNMILNGASKLALDSGEATASDSAMLVDLSESTLMTINELREAFATQRFLEVDARGGTRYAEIVKAHFDVDFYDITYRPEYLGGGSAPVIVNPVAATAISGTRPVADLGAFATMGDNNSGFTKTFTEHGIVLGIVSIRGDLTYQQGMNRAFSRSTRYDYYWPEFANLGEQAVLNKEIYWSGTQATDDAVFGYQERYAEYRYKPSQITGLLRSEQLDSLDVWHLSEMFLDTPVLGDDFIQDQTPVDRVVAIANQPHFILDSLHQLRCARPMPVFSVPGLTRL